MARGLEHYIAPGPMRLQVSLNSKSSALRGRRGDNRRASLPHQLLSTGHSPIPSHWSSCWNHLPGLACGRYLLPYATKRCQLQPIHTLTGHQCLFPLLIRFLVPERLPSAPRVPTHLLPFPKACPPLSIGPKVLLLFLFFGITLVIYLAPLFISSPCIMKLGDLPPKPGLVGHRGAPMVSDRKKPGQVRENLLGFSNSACGFPDPYPSLLHPPDSLSQLAPENTLMSLRKTAECGATVFETDVMVR